MKRDFNCSYSILGSDLICEHKSAKLTLPDTVTLHNHDGFELVLFLNGNLSMIVESVEKKLVRGDLVIVPPFKFHGLNLTKNDVAQASDYERILINIKPEYFRALGNESTDLHSFISNEAAGPFNVIHIDEAALSDFVNALNQIEAHLKDDSFGHELMAQSAFTMFLISLARYSHHAPSVDVKNTLPDLVSKIFDLVEANLSENITVEALASLLNHNSDYISRVFKKTTGGSLKHYINAKKISKAQQYLSLGYSPSAVCYMVGYENYSSFSRRFHEHVGLSPRQYI